MLCPIYLILINYLFYYYNFKIDNEADINHNIIASFNKLICI